MRFALVGGERVEATKGARGTCECCNSEVIAKCGVVNIHHWAHKNNDDCDPWYETETQWHRDVKDWFPKVCQEVVMGRHRADVQLSAEGATIEVQNSSITREEIEERNEYYGLHNKFVGGSGKDLDLIWIINGDKFKDRFYMRDQGGWYKFHWSHARKCWSAVKDRCLYIHFPEEKRLFRVHKSSSDMKHGWGKLVEDKRQLRNQVS